MTKYLALVIFVGCVRMLSSSQSSEAPALSDELSHLFGNAGSFGRPAPGSRRKDEAVRLRTCRFPVGLTDETGKLISTTDGSARCFDESLGNGLAITMIEIPAGSFSMGSPESETGRKPDESPLHRVALKRFFVGQFEITYGQWLAIRDRPRLKHSMESLSQVSGETRLGAAVEGISWTDAVEFCSRLRALTGKNYRLPSEAEWEYASRAGSDAAYSFGPSVMNSLVNWRTQKDALDGRYGVEEVGKSGPANAFGLFDVHGNVEEWVADDYHETYVGAPADGSAWYFKKRPSTRKDGVSRGGAWGDGTIEQLRCASRAHWDRRLRASGLGMRVSMSPDD